MYVYATPATILRATFVDNKAGTSGRPSFSNPPGYRPLDHQGLPLQAQQRLPHRRRHGRHRLLHHRPRRHHPLPPQLRPPERRRRSGSASASSPSPTRSWPTTPRAERRSAYATASLTFDNVSVSERGGPERRRGAHRRASTGRFSNTDFVKCNASLHQGALAAWNDVVEVTVEGGSFAQCGVEEQGGACDVRGGVAERGEQLVRGARWATRPSRSA